MTGRDEDTNGESIQYSIVRGNKKKLFSINNKGVLSISRKIGEVSPSKKVYKITISGSQPADQAKTLIHTNIVFGDFPKPKTKNCLSISNIVKTTKNTIQGSSCPDLWTGNEADEWINADDGHDEIRGEAGHDTIHGGPGHDTIHGGPGLDSLKGDSGNDQLNGRRRADILRGGLDHDLLKGKRGPDLLLGEQGDDTLRGGSDNDTLRGGPGNDVLQGSAGDDILQGGTGADLFRLSTGRDRILDFELAQGDRISFGDHINLNIQQQGTNLLLSDPYHNIETLIENTLINQWRNQ